MEVSCDSIKESKTKLQNPNQTGTLSLGAKLGKNGHFSGPQQEKVVHFLP